MSDLNVLDRLELDTVLDGVVDDHSETVGFSRDPMPEGWAFARLVEYVEYGVHPQMYQGKPAPSAPEVRFGFEVTPVKWDNAEPRPVEIMHITVKKKKNDKAGFTKLFMAMRDGREHIRHSVDFIKNNDVFFIMVSHSESKTKAGVLYANLDKAQVRRAVDVVSGNTYAMPAYPEGYTPAQYRVFLWDNPRKDMWDSLYIDGEYEKEVNGVKVKVSKNFMQETCLTALNFKGSALHHMLLDIYGSGYVAQETVSPEQVQEQQAQQAQPEQPTQPVQQTQQPTAPSVAQAVQTPAKQPAPVAESAATPPAPTAKQNTADMLAELGIKL